MNFIDQIKKQIHIVKHLNVKTTLIQVIELFNGCFFCLFFLNEN